MLLTLGWRNIVVVSCDFQPAGGVYSAPPDPQLISRRGEGRGEDRPSARKGMKRERSGKAKG